MTQGLSGADIEILCNSIKITYVLNDIKEFNEKMLFDLFLKYQTRTFINNKNNVQDIEERKVLLAKNLRHDNKKMFGIKTLSKMLNYSTGKTSLLMREDNENG